MEAFDYGFTTFSCSVGLNLGRSITALFLFPFCFVPICLFIEITYSPTFEEWPTSWGVSWVGAVELVGEIGVTWELGMRVAFFCLRDQPTDIFHPFT